jgi:hypothetical protein
MDCRYDHLLFYITTVGGVMSIEAMRQALEALEYHQEQTRPIHKTQETITALRQAIEQAEKPVEPPDYVEPVTTDYHEGWEEGFKAGNALTPPKRPVKSYTGGVPQYATDAPKREWVGLTDEEILLVNGNEDYSTIAAPDAELIEFTRAIEAKLKEKNV